MSEFLYCPVTNTVILFEGDFVLDAKLRILVMKLMYGGKKPSRKICIKDLVHIGWL